MISCENTASAFPSADVCIDPQKKKYWLLREKRFPCIFLHPFPFKICSPLHLLRVQLNGYMPMHCRRIENPEPYHFGIALATYSYSSSVAYLESLNLCYLPFLKQLRFYKPGAFIHLCTTLEDHSSFIYPIAVDSLSVSKGLIS